VIPADPSTAKFPVQNAGLPFQKSAFSIGLFFVAEGRVLFSIRADSPNWYIEAENLPLVFASEDQVHAW
jgi:hypothetical protein